MMTVAVVLWLLDRSIFEKDASSGPGEVQQQLLKYSPKLLVIASDFEMVIIPIMFQMKQIPFFTS